MIKYIAKFSFRDGSERVFGGESKVLDCIEGEEEAIEEAKQEGWTLKSEHGAHSVRVFVGKIVEDVVIE